MITWSARGGGEDAERRDVGVRTTNGRVPILNTLREVANPEHSALVVIDLQNDLCSPDGAYARQGRDLSMINDVIANSQCLLEAARRAHVPVVHVQMTMLPELRSMSASYLRFMMRKNNTSRETHCELGSWGAETVRDVAPRSEEVIIQKWRSSAFVGTPLDLLLRSNGLLTVVICGIATEACVESTVRDAFNSDYYVIVAEDCVGSYRRDLHDASLAVMRARVDVVKGTEVVGLWSSPDA